MSVRKVARKRSTSLAWGLGGLALAATCGEIALALLEPRGLPLVDPNRTAWVDYLESIFFPFVGVFVAWKRPSNAVGWLLLTYSVGEAAGGLIYSYGEYGVLTGPDSLPGAGIAAWVSSWAWILFLSLIPFTLLHFPTGLPSTRWRWARWMCGLPAMLMAAPAAAWFGKPAPEYRLIEEGDFLGAEWAGPLLSVIFALLILSVLTSVASLAIRYRGAGQLERQQLKWILLAAGVLAVQGIWEIFLPGSADLKAVAGALAFAGIPISMGIAILRYRLYDIDRLSFVDRRFYRNRYNAIQTLEEFTTRLRDEVELASLTRDLLATVDRTLQPAHASLWRNFPGSRR